VALINNIPMIQGASAGISLTGQGASLVPQGGLAGFMNLILSPTGGQQLLTGQADLQLIAAKIAGALSLDPTDPAAMQQIMQQLQAASKPSANLVPKIDGIKSSLTSDLSAQLVTQAQSTEGTVELDQIAALLNQMEPGTGLVTESSLDGDILEKLTEMFQEASADIKLSADALKQIEQELRKFLQEQNIDGKTADKYMAALSASLNVELTGDTKTPLPAAPNTLPQGKKAELNVKPGALPTFSDKPEVAAEKPVPVPAPQPAAKASASSLAMINAMSQKNDGSGFGHSSDQGGFMQQNGMNGDISAYMKASGDVTGTSFINHLSAARSSMPAQTTQMIALQIQQNAAAKVTSFSIQLDPADLGRLDIRMKFEKDGSMKAHMSAERPETLSMLQRDQQHLNRVLQQAGIDVDENSLSFDLRQQSQQQDLNGSGNDGTRTGYNNAPRNNDGAIDNAIQAKIAVEAAGYITRSGVNIMV
jgi:flagellar hook-length control protein FliK